MSDFPKAEVGNCQFCMRDTGCCTMRDPCPHCGESFVDREKRWAIEEQAVRPQFTPSERQL